MQPHPAYRPGRDADERLFILPIVEAEEDALAGLLASGLAVARDRREHASERDQDVIAKLDAQLRIGRRALIALDHSDSPVPFELLEVEELRLPKTRTIVTGIGVELASSTYLAVRGSGRGEREAWAIAAREIARLLAQSLLAGGRPDNAVPLARLYRALLRESLEHQN